MATLRLVSPAWPSAALPARRRGFSLLELLVVIVIIALLAGLVVPSIGNNAARDAADAAQRMMLLINQAQQEAVMSSRTWQVVLDPEADTYYFQQQSGAGFEDVSLEPFAGRHATPSVDLDGLEINGRPVSGDPGEVYLFPTAEQDHFRVILKGGGAEYVIAMGPVGAARVDE